MRERRRKSQFYQWILENKAVLALMIIFLLSLNVFMFTKISYLLAPVGQFIAIVGLPILLSVVLYYLLNPIVNFLEKKKIPRVVGISGIFVVLILLMIWGLVVLIPNILEQMNSFFNQFPNYVHKIDVASREVADQEMFQQYRSELNNWINSMSATLITWAQTFSKNLFTSIGDFVTAVTTIVVGLITMPFILFFLLKDGRKLLPNILNLLPVTWRKHSKSIIIEMNSQLASYIRGQITVAICVSIMFIIGFKIIGLDYAVTLGITAGFLNLIPYLGSFLAMVPAVLLGFAVGPIMLVKVLVVFAVEQTLEGRFISPLVLGNQMSIHPVTILLVLLTSGKIGGLMGVIIGIPVYAMLRVLITHIYTWYRETSGLFDES